MPPIITLTTDFGLSDPYAGQMKAAILAIATEARIVDLTHLIAPQAVGEAAFVLETSWRHFPDGTIHVVVVDPEVGGSRRRLVLRSGGHFFVGPDNGCLSAALPEASRGLRAAEAGYNAGPLEAPGEVEAVSIERLDLLPRPRSATFEGRDVFAPVAAHIASGRQPAEFGRRATEVLAFPAFRGPPVAGGLDGMVVRVDHFGNLITDLRAADVRPGSSVQIAGMRLPLARTYVGADGLAALEGSSDYIEVAMPNGSAAAALAAGVGTQVIVSF
jgi:S-adenosylmethionine hydrolase